MNTPARQFSPTAKSIAAFRDRLTAGARVKCLENTYIPERAGLVATVATPGKTSIRLDAAGATSWMNFPARVRDVVALTRNTITYRIEHRGENTCTWEILES